MRWIARSAASGIAVSGKATFKNGVLEIVIDMPARKAPDAQRIAIGG